jgi:hypothetical protein
MTGMTFNSFTFQYQALYYIPIVHCSSVRGIVTLTTFSPLSSEAVCSHSIITMIVYLGLDLMAA